VLEKANAARGRFRGLLLSVAKHTVLDRLRKRGETPEPDLEPADERDGQRDAAFDREWILELSSRALERLRLTSPSYHTVLAGHLAGEPQTRNKLWIARGKLRALIRDEVAQTCASPEQLDDELAYLEGYLRPDPKAGKARGPRERTESE
jgi:hypothetical protein